MYCSACGVAVARGLSYCNHCGAKLNAETGESLSKVTELRAESLIIAGMVRLFVLGLLALTVLMGVMKVVLGLDGAQVFGFGVLSFLTMVAIEGVLVSRLYRRRGAEEKGGRALAQERATNELDAAHARALPEGVPSVTEHTTRSFTPVYGERKSE